MGWIRSRDIRPGAIGASNLATGSVTATKLAADAVTADKIAAGAVTASELASDAVTSVKILNGAVGTSKVAPGAIDHSVLSEKVENSVTVTVPTAEVLALNATPKQLVAAPGAGKAIIVTGVQFMLNYNSAAYNGIAAGEDLAVRYTNGSGTIVAHCEATGFLDAVADAYRFSFAANNASGSISEVTPVANAAIVLHMLTGEIATGNSDLIVKVFYRIITLDLTA